MRPFLYVLAFTALFGMSAATATATGAFTSGPALSAPTTAYATVAQDPPAKVNIDINTNKSGGGHWYASPMWMAIGGIALVVVILLIVMAARGGGGTTVVRG